MPSLCHGSLHQREQQLHQTTKANDQREAVDEDLLEMNMSDALDRICGTSSLESLPGKKLIYSLLHQLGSRQFCQLHKIAFIRMPITSVLR